MLEENISKNKNAPGLLSGGGNGTPIMTWITNANGHCIYLNKQWYDYTGHAPETGMGFGRLSALHPDDAKQAEDTFLDANKKQIPYSITCRLKKYTGEYRWHIESGVPKFDIRGNFEGFIGSVIDIHESVVASKKIEQSQEQFRLLANNSPVLIWVNGTDGCEFVNQAYLEFLGVTPDDIRNYDWAKFVHPDDRDNYLAAYQKAVLKKEKFEAQFRFLRADGQYRWMKSAGFPRINPSGELEGYVGSTTDVHDIISAQKKIEESEKRYHNIFETAEVSLWEEDFTELKAAIDTLKQHGISDFRKYFNEHPEFVEKALKLIKVIDVNQATLEMFEAKDKSELLGSLPKIFTPESLHVFIEEMITIAEERTYFEAEAKLKTVKGNTVYILFTMKLPLPFEKFDRVLFSCLNISERKKAEKALRESEERNRLFIKHAPAAMAMFDKEMRYISVSRQWMKEYDLTGNIVGRKHYELFPNILQRWKDVHARCMQGAVEQSDEDFYIKDNGTPVWLKWDVYPWRDAANKIGGIVIFTENITERKKAAQALQESESRFRAMANEAPLFVWETDEKLQTIFLNKTGLRYFNFDEKTGLDKLSWKNFIHPDDIDRVLNIMKHHAQINQSYSLEMRLKNGVTGEYGWFLDKGSPKYKDGKFTGFIGTSLDIQDRKETEQQLESKILERTKELKHKNEELQESIRLLRNQELKDEQKNNFIAMASHELKTPITSIKGYVQLLLNAFDRQKDETKALPPLLVRSSLISVDKQVTRLTRLISELLDLSKIETGTLELRKEKFSLNELAIETIEDILYTNSSHHINLYHDFHGYVYADRDRIGQVMINFLTNAIKYSPASTRIDATLHQFAKDEIAFSVKDFGIGIDKEEQQKIFERFYRSKGKEEQTYPGFGIGLFIANEFVQKHGGRMLVESEKGKGSIFTFTLPLYLN